MDPNRRRIPPTHAIGYGGVEELEGADFTTTARALGLDLVEASSEVESDDERVSHAPEAAGLRATYPSLDRISLA